MIRKEVEMSGLSFFVAVIFVAQFNYSSTMSHARSAIAALLPMLLAVRAILAWT